MKLEIYLKEIVDWIREKVKAANAVGVIVGISGGIDSALVANLAKQAFPNDYLTVWMPLHSSLEDEECKNALVNENNLKFKTVNLLSTFNEIKTELNLPNETAKSTQLALANTKARLRMTTLYSLAQSHNYLVLGTDNADEWHIGYFTKFGDGGCDLLPIVHLLKQEVKEAAKFYNVPNIIIDRKPTAGLWENQTDEAEIGFSYEIIDRYLIGENVSTDAKERIEYLHFISEHKRNGALQPKKIIR
ncbi:NAD(+) synthase [Spiroplasma endosymbiont of Labia minor]|uniref:NAD(+) synthase n=1 Tax=Spiroplasma endosymbiont of Labia minor TaxID=3066305 RepID=UPI0030D20914